MKKQQMIELINYALDELVKNNNNITGKEILEIVTRAGMAPPPVDFERGQLLMRVYMGASSRKWDEEVDQDPAVLKHLERSRAYKEKINSITKEQILDAYDKVLTRPALCTTHRATVRVSEILGISRFALNKLARKFGINPLGGRKS